MGGDTPRDLPRRLIARRFMIVFVAAIWLTFAAEHLIEMVIGHGDSAACRSLFDAREIYGRLVASWPRRLTSRHTVLMTIDTRPITHDGIEPGSFRWYRVGDALCYPGEVDAAFAEWCGARKPAGFEYLGG